MILKELTAGVFIVPLSKPVTGMLRQRPDVTVRGQRGGDVGFFGFPRIAGNLSLNHEHYSLSNKATNPPGATRHPNAATGTDALAVRCFVLPTPSRDGMGMY